MADQQPTTIVPVPGVVQLREYLVKKRDQAIEVLKDIKSIENDEQAAEAKETLVAVKTVYDRMSERRKAFLEPLKKIFEELIAYENAINYTSDKDNDYNRPRKVIEAYDQKKLEEVKLKEYEAKLAADQLKYKAEFKAKVMQQLTDMIAGKHRTLISSMVNWEKSLVLANIAEQEVRLRGSDPKLKVEDYDKCFQTWRKDAKVMTEKEELDYLAELKKELTYAIYNEKYQQIAAPIKNEYLAKIPVIKQALEEQDKADAKRKEELRVQREKDLQAQQDAAIAKANEVQAKETQAISDEKDLGTMNADFTQQMMTADVEKGPIKKIAWFVSERAWLEPFLKVVSKVGAHPKFKGISNAKGEYIPEIDKWMKFYSQYIGEDLPGLTFEEKAKTLIKK